MIVISTMRVLQGLKRTDRHPELLTGLEVFKRSIIRKLHSPDRLGADQGGGIVHHGFDQRQGLSFRADQRIRREQPSRRNAHPRRVNYQSSDRA